MRRGLTDRSLEEGSYLESKRNGRTEYFRINVTTATATPRLTEFGDRVGEVEMQLPENFVSIRDKILDAEMAVMKLNVPLSKLPQCEVSVIDKDIREYPNNFSLISDQKIFVLPLGWSKKNSASISLSTTRYESLYEQSYFEQNPNGINWSVVPINISPPHFYELNQSNLLSIINKCLQEGKREYNTIAEYFADLSLASTDVLKQAVPLALMGSYLRLANLWFTLDTDNTISLHYIPPLLDINLHTPMISCEGYTSDMRTTSGTLFDDTSKAMPYIQDGNRSGFIHDGESYRYKLESTTTIEIEEGSQSISYTNITNPNYLVVSRLQDRMDTESVMYYWEYINTRDPSSFLGYVIGDPDEVLYWGNPKISTYQLPTTLADLRLRVNPEQLELAIDQYSGEWNEQMVFGSYTNYDPINSTLNIVIPPYHVNNVYTSLETVVSPSTSGYTPDPPNYTQTSSSTTSSTTYSNDETTEPPSEETTSIVNSPDILVSSGETPGLLNFFQVKQNSSSVIKTSMIQITSHGPFIKLGTGDTPGEFPYRRIWTAEVKDQHQRIFELYYRPSSLPKYAAVRVVQTGADIYDAWDIDVHDMIDYVEYTDENNTVKRAYPIFKRERFVNVWDLYGLDRDTNATGSPFYSVQFTYQDTAHPETDLTINSLINLEYYATYNRTVTKTTTTKTYELSEANSDSIKIDPFVIGGNLSLKKMFPSLPWIKISKDMFYSDAIRDTTTSSYVPIERQINPQLFIDASSRGNGESDENLYILDTRQTSASVLTTHPYKVLLGSEYEVYKIPEFVLKFTASDAVSLSTINSILLTMNGVVFNQEVYPVNFTSQSASSAQTGTIPVIENYLPLITRPSDLTTNMIVSRTDFANAAPIKINPSLLKERSIKFKLHYVTKNGEMKEMLIPDDAPFTFQLCFGLTIASF